MKKKCFAVLAFILVLAMSMPMVAIADEPVMPDVRIISPTEGAVEISLADFDFIVEVIMENLPTQGIAERRFQGELAELFALIREHIASGTPQPAWTSLLWGEDWIEAPTDDLTIAAEYLGSIFLELFGLVLESFAHMGPLSPQEVERIITELLRVVHIVENDIEVEQDISVAIAITDIFLDTFLDPGVLRVYGIDLDAIDATDLEVVLMPAVEGNITTAVLVPDSVAYIHIATFMSDPVVDSDIMAEFFSEVQDFEHLIIDVRGNGGGLPVTVFHGIVGALIDEPMDFGFTEFFSSGDLAVEIFEQGGYVHTVIPYARLYGIFPAEEYIAANDLTGFVLSDLDYIQYAARWYIHIDPFEGVAPFAGDIWVLTDRGSASASELLTLISVSTGFATTVGEPTAGVTGVTTLFVPLPQTGLLFRIDIASLTDPIGRSLEEFGIIPQIPNAEGLDALETVMSIIAPDLLEEYADLEEEDEEEAEELEETPTEVEVDVPTETPIPYVPAPRTHTVLRGESLFSITRQFTGNGARWGELYELNQEVIWQLASPAMNGRLIFPGQVLVIPDNW